MLHLDPNCGHILLTLRTLKHFSFFSTFLSIFSKILFDREHKQREQQAEEELEAGSPLSKEPDAGLNPRTLGS